ncbi:MAG TPA: hypothetical protein VIF15_00260 [Polyangiaceae bacterium]|jgi:hypothetical protein
MRKLLLLGVTAVTLGFAGASLQCGGSAEGTVAEPGPSGSVPGFGSVPTWGQQVRDGKGLATSATSVDVHGNLFVAGTLYGTSDLGTGPVTSAGGGDVLLAKIDATGHTMWTRDFGDRSDQFAYSVATDAAGNVVIAGSFAGALDFGNGGPLLSPDRTTASPTLPDRALRAIGARDVFVAKLDGDGGLLWAAQFGGQSATAEARAVAIGATGDIALTGSFDHVVSFGGDPHPAAGPTDAFVTLLDPAGRPVWTRTWGDGIGMHGTSVAVDAWGDVLATGTFEGTVDLGNGPLISHGGRDVFLAKLGGVVVTSSRVVPALSVPGGRTLWSKGFGDQWDDYAIAVAVDRAGDTFTLAQYTGTVDLGAGPLAANGERFFGSADIFVARYDRGGQAAWARHYGAPNIVDWADALAVDADGNAYFSGRIFNPIVVGGCDASPTIAVREQGQAIVAKVDPNGNGVCVHRYGDGAWSEVRALAVHPARGLIMVGEFEGAIDLSQGPLVSPDAPSGFIAREDVFPTPLL